jgi:hypothetical protein
MREEHGETQNLKACDFPLESILRGSMSLTLKAIHKIIHTAI